MTTKAQQKLIDGQWRVAEARAAQNAHGFRVVTTANRIDYAPSSYATIEDAQVHRDEVIANWDRDEAGGGIHFPLSVRIERRDGDVWQTIPSQAREREPRRID